MEHNTFLVRILLECKRWITKTVKYERVAFDLKDHGKLG
jgi:hypothetical protein